MTINLCKIMSKFCYDETPRLQVTVKFIGLSNNRTVDRLHS